MKTKWIIICCTVLLVGGGILFARNQLKQNANNLMQFSIYPTGTSDETYYFALNQNGILKCAVGSRKNNNINQRDFLKHTVDSSEKQLDEQEVQTLIKFADALEATRFDKEKRIVKDSWDIAFSYKGRVYEMNWHINDSEELRKLTGTFISLSPISVDLHGWA